MSDSDENYAAQIDDSLSDSSLDDPSPPEVVEQPEPIVKKKRVQSPAQKAALEKGRAKALANRLARKKEKEDGALESKKKQQKPKEPKPEPEPVAPPKKPKKPKRVKKERLPTPPSSSSEYATSSSEDEIVLPKRKSKPKRTYDDQPPSLHFV